MNSIISFKDIIDKKRIIEIDHSKETRYTYDEFTNKNIEIAINKNIEDNLKHNKITKYEIDKYEFLDENDYFILDILDSIKEQYSIQGFINDMTYSDINNIIFKNIIIDKIIINDEENELLLDDDFS